MRRQWLTLIEVWWQKFSGKIAAGERGQSFPAKWSGRIGVRVFRLIDANVLFWAVAIISQQFLHPACFFFYFFWQQNLVLARENPLTVKWISQFMSFEFNFVTLAGAPALCFFFSLWPSSLGTFKWICFALLVSFSFWFWYPLPFHLVCFQVWLWPLVSLSGNGADVFGLQLFNFYIFLQLLQRPKSRVCFLFAANRFDSFFSLDCWACFLGFLHWVNCLSNYGYWRQKIFLQY